MLGATLFFYLMVLIMALVITSSASIGFQAMLVLGVLCLILTVVFRAIGLLFKEYEYKAPKSRRVIAPQVPQHIVDYLTNHDVEYEARHHYRAVSAQRLAHSIHTSADRIAKPIVVKADGQLWMAVLPASEKIDFDSLADVLHAKSVEMISENDLEELFPKCELGAEPPFGHLYGLPVIIDAPLPKQDSVVFRAGSHRDSVEISYADYEALEHPIVASFGIRHELAH